MSYWIVACKADQSADPIDFYKGRLGHLAGSLFKFAVPQELCCKSFDTLIKLLDDLQKQDGQIEATLRRVEKQMRETYSSSAPAFDVVSQGQTCGYEAYLQQFKWDDNKFPVKRDLTLNITQMLSAVVKLDDTLRNQVSSLSELKTAAEAIKKKDAPFVSRDLIDVLTPDVVKADDFVESSHLTTVVVVVPRGAEKDFLGSYLSMSQYIVPDSAKQFAGLVDKDGNTLWRVVLFKNSAEEFKTASRQKRFIARDFTYSAEAYAKHDTRRGEITKELSDKEDMLQMICRACFSDTFIAWTHLKAARTYVESLLRYGVKDNGEPNFVAMLIKVSDNEKQKAQLRAALATLSEGGAANVNIAEDEEYYPYVSLTLRPLAE